MGLNCPCQRVSDHFFPILARQNRARRRLDLLPPEKSGDPLRHKRDNRMIRERAQPRVVTLRQYNRSEAFVRGARFKPPAVRHLTGRHESVRP